MAAEKAPDVEISVILPCYNEEGNIEPLVRELTEVLRPLGHPYEIVYVDDASTDGSVEKIRQVSQKYPGVRLVRHKLNCGESAALVSGFENSTGEVIITMDADLQNDPHDIPKLLKVLETCDIVCGVRTKRKDNLVRRISTRIANKVRDTLLHDGIHDAGCTFRAFRRRVLVNLIAFKGLHRFLPTLCRIHRFKVREVPINHRPRLKGYSKYGISNRLFVGIHDIFGIRWYRKRHFPPRRY